jgi:hypothetical protein
MPSPMGCILFVDDVITIPWFSLLLLESRVLEGRMPVDMASY